MTDAAGERHTGRGAGVRVVVVAVVKARIEADRLCLQPAERDLLGARGRAGRDHDRPFEPVGKVHGPLQGAHAAHRAADDRVPGLDAEFDGEGALDGDLVLHGDDRKTGPVGASVPSPRARPGRALAATEHVRADDEVAVGVDRRPRADDRAPPSRARMPGLDRAADV